MNPDALSAAPARPHSARARSTRPTLAALAVLGLCALMAGCAVLGNKPAPPLTSYALADVAQTTAPAAAPPEAKGTRVLLVELPQAAPGYDSARMVYVRQPHTLEAYAHSVWVDTPARMLAPLLVGQLQASGLFRAVLQAPRAAQAELRLDSRILWLQQDFLQVPSRVHFSMQLDVIDNQTRAVLASRRIDVTQDAPSEDAAGGAQAAQQLVQQALLQTATFLQATLAVPH